MDPSLGQAEASAPLPTSSAFQHALEKPDWSMVINAVQAGVPVETLRTRTGLTALAVAVLDDMPTIVDNLLKAGASPQAFAKFNGEHFSPLWAALTRHHEQVARMLLYAGADPNETSLGRFPVVFAAQEGLAITTRALCVAGARPDPDPRQSALHLWLPQTIEQHPQRGTVFGSIDPIMALVDAGANADARDAQGRSVPDAARVLWAAFLGGRHAAVSAEATIVALDRSLLRHALRDVDGEERVHRRL